MSRRPVMKYSNCLIEAVKAKLRDPEHIRIIMIRPHVVTKDCHFAWTDGEYFYHAYGHNRKWWARYWYKPIIKKVPLIVFESFVCDKLKGEPIEYQKKVLKELGIHLADIPYTSCDRWCWLLGEKDLPKEEDVRYLEKLYRGKVFIKVVTVEKGMKVVTYEQLLKMKIKNGCKSSGWRYVTQMDTPDFQGLYGYHIRVPIQELSDEIANPTFLQRRKELEEKRQKRDNFLNHFLKGGTFGKGVSKRKNLQ